MVKFDPACVEKAKHEQRALLQLTLDGKYLPTKSERGKIDLAVSISPAMARKLWKVIHELMADNRKPAGSTTD